MEQVSKGMMQELDSAKRFNPVDLNMIISDNVAGYYFGEISKWYLRGSHEKNSSRALRLIKHIWLNESQFEEEKPKKYVVQTKNEILPGQKWTLVDTGIGFYQLFNIDGLEVKFDTREEAEKYSNPQTEIVEVAE